MANLLTGEFALLYCYIWQGYPLLPWLVIFGDPGNTVVRENG